MSRGDRASSSLAALQRIESRRRLGSAGFLKLPGGLGGDAARRGADIAGSGHDLLDDAAVFNFEGGVVPGSGLKRLALLARHLSFFSGGTSFHGVSTFARRWLASIREACLWSGLHQGELLEVVFDFAVFK